MSSLKSDSVLACAKNCIIVNIYHVNANQRGKKPVLHLNLKIKILGKTNKILKHSHKSLTFVCMFKIHM